MNSGFAFKAPKTRSLGSKLAQKQMGTEKTSNCPATRAFRSSSVGICKTKSMLGRRRTKLFDSPNPITPIRNLNPQPSSSNVKKPPDWTTTPGPDHSKFFESDICQLGPWSAFKTGPPLKGIRTPVYTQLPKRTNGLKHPKPLSESSDNESEEETKRKLKELDNIPLCKTALFPSKLSGGRVKLEKEDIYEPPAVLSPGTLKRVSSPSDTSAGSHKRIISPKATSLGGLKRSTAGSKSLPRVTFSPRSPSKINSSLDLTAVKRDVKQILQSKLKELREHSVIISTLSTEIQNLQDELDRLTTLPTINIVPPYDTYDNDENEEPPEVDEGEEKSPKQESDTAAPYKTLAYTPRSLKKVYRNQYRDIFM